MEDEDLFNLNGNNDGGEINFDEYEEILINQSPIKPLQDEYSNFNFNGNNDSYDNIISNSNSQQTPPPQPKSLTNKIKDWYGHELKSHSRSNSKSDSNSNGSGSKRNSFKDDGQLNSNIGLYDNIIISSNGSASNTSQSTTPNILIDSEPININNKNNNNIFEEETNVFDFNYFDLTSKSDETTIIQSPNSLGSTSIINNPPTITTTNTNNNNNNITPNSNPLNNSTQIFESININDTKVSTPTSRFSFSSFKKVLNNAIGKDAEVENNKDKTPIINTTTSNTTTITNNNNKLNDSGLNYSTDRLNYSTDRFLNELSDDSIIQSDDTSDFERWLRLGEDIPQSSWSRKLDDNFPEHKSFQVGVSQGLKLVGIGYRMWRYVKKELTSNRLPIMDPFNPPKPGPIMGVPIGGLGSGSITRGWKGDFVRWNLSGGIVDNNIIDVNKFSAFINFINPKTGQSVDNTQTKKAVVLYPGKPNSNFALDVWNWSLKGDQSCYFALYPRAWHVYEEPHPNIRLTCKQISPVIPNNYKESSYPCGVYVWKIENSSKLNDAEVSLMFTWQNSDGTNSDVDGGHYNKFFNFKKDDKSIKGITLVHNKEKRVKFDNQQYSFYDPFELSIGVDDSEGVEFSYHSRFDTTSRLDAANIWYNFNKTGKLENMDDMRPSFPGKPIGAAIAAKVLVPAGTTKTIVFGMAWDSPICRFKLGSGYYRRYTKFYGTEGSGSQDILFDALQQYPQWEREIVEWQQPILNDPLLPTYYKMALFNELYYLVDGGTVWTNGSPLPDGKSPTYPSNTLLKQPSEDPNSVGRFAYLESHEYLMYNTYDVHFYASFALASLWPLLEISLQYDISNATLLDYNLNWEGIHNGNQIPRKKRGAVPHDLGNPGEDPWKRVNSYNIQDISRWKDLPSKFVLQVYRDYLVIGNDKNFLLQVYNVISEVIRRTSQEFDLDRDGVVDNEGFPDQTYDIWSASGCSAYTGGLWLAALKAASEIAKILGFKEDESIYNSIFEKGKQSYTKKLWNGHYFKYDSSKSVHSDSIMADMLAGHWYLLSCGLDSYITLDQALSSLSFINEYNIKSYGKEICGAVNGMRPDGSVDNTCLQSAEVWIGTSFALAANMFLHYMDKEGWELVKGIVNSSYNKWGFQFQTPEAWDQNGLYRASSYMRPLAIWSIQWAIDKRKNLPFLTKSLTNNNNKNNNLI